MVLADLSRDTRRSLFLFPFTSLFCSFAFSYSATTPNMQIASKLLRHAMGRQRVDSVSKVAKTNSLKTRKQSRSFLIFRDLTKLKTSASKLSSLNSLMIRLGAILAKSNLQ